MTIIDEILSCANQVANSGKKPTVALVKAKLNQPVPLPTIIATLKNWQHEPEFTSCKVVQDEKANQDISLSNAELVDSILKNNEVKKMIEESLHKELQEMKQELADMKLLIQTLTEQLQQKIKNE